MPFSRRSIAKTVFLAPAILSDRTFARQNDRIQPLDTGDVFIKSISPDGSTLMGLADRDRIVFLDAETLDEIARTEPVAEIKPIDERSIAWSPDSNMIAFSLDAWRLGRDSDIFIVDTATGALTNATPEGHEQEAPTLFDDDAEDLLIDVYPLWLDTNTILFGRHNISDEITCVLSTLDISNADVTAWAPLHPANIRYISGPIHQVGEDRVAFSGTDFNPPPLVAVASASGEIEFLEAANMPYPTLIDADEAYAYLVSSDGLGEVQRVSIESGESQPLHEVLGFEALSVQLTYPACGPESGSFAVVAHTAKGDTEVILFDGAESRVVAVLDDFPVGATCHWVEGRLLITNRDNTYLIDIESWN